MKRLRGEHQALVLLEQRQLFSTCSFLTMRPNSENGMTFFAGCAPIPEPMEKQPQKDFSIFLTPMRITDERKNHRRRSNQNPENG
jgi:hypothetical protein